MLVDSKYKIFTYVGNQFNLSQLYPEEKDQIKYIQSISSTGLSFLTWKPQGLSNLINLENCKTYLLVSNSDNPNYNIDFTIFESSSIGRFFKVSQQPGQLVSQSTDNFLAISIKDPDKAYLARQVVLNGYQNVWLKGRVFIGQKNYNSFRNFYIDPETIEIIQSQNPPNLNSNLSFVDIENKLNTGIIQEGAEVCFSFSNFAEEMKIKGLSACFAPLLWESNIGVDTETGEYVQFGFCSGECPNGKTTDSYCERCTENSTYVQSLEDWNTEYQNIVQTIQDQTNSQTIDILDVFNRLYMEERTQEEIQLDEEIANMDEITNKL